MYVAFLIQYYQDKVSSDAFAAIFSMVILTASKKQHFSYFTSTKKIYTLLF